MPELLDRIAANEAPLPVPADLAPTLPSISNASIRFIRAQERIRLSLSKLIAPCELINITLGVLHSIVAVRFGSQLVFGDAVDISANSAFLNALEGYSIAILALLDLANNALWLKHRNSLARIEGSFKKMRGYRTSLFRASLQMIGSARHLFQLINVIFCLMAPFSPTSKALILGQHSLNQLAQSYYNAYRVQKYQAILTGKENFLIYTSSQRRGHGNAERQITTPPDVDVNNNIVNNSYSNDNTGSNGKRCKHNIYDLTGWSHWPIQLYNCDCHFRDSLAFNFEKILIISQLLNVKLGIFNMSMRLDNRKPSTILVAHYSGSQQPKYWIFACLFQSFLAMYSYYDKLHYRYKYKRYAV